LAPAPDRVRDAARWAAWAGRTSAARHPSVTATADGVAVRVRAMRVGRRPGTARRAPSRGRAEGRRAPIRGGRWGALVNLRAW